MLCPISESICVVCGVHAWCCARLHVVYTCSLCSALCIVVCAHIYTPRATSITHTAGSSTMRYYRLHVFDLSSLLKNQNGTEERHTIGTQYTLTRHCFISSPLSPLDRLFLVYVIYKQYLSAHVSGFRDKRILM